MEGGQRGNVSAAPRTILVVDDDRSLRERLARAFEDRGLVAMVAGDLEGAAFAAQAGALDLAVVDLQLSRASGLEIIQRLRAISDRTRILVLSGPAELVAMKAALRIGAVAGLRKPADADQILDALASPPAPPEAP
jgi:two-component system response regulator RegA